jgi:EAL domain-containing protein (putative c-di-GMP-specific phosphodiesterase class I)
LNLTRNPGDVGIVTTIISLAHSLKLKVVAEGVETQEQANLLRLFKCDEMQGFLFSPAVPAEQVEILLREGRQLPT